MSDMYSDDPVTQQAMARRRAIRSKLVGIDLVSKAYKRGMSYDEIKKRAALTGNEIPDYDPRTSTLGIITGFHIVKQREFLTYHMKIHVVFNVLIEGEPIRKKVEAYDSLASHKMNKSLFMVCTKSPNT